MLTCFIKIAYIPGLTLQTDTQLQEPADSKSFFPIYQRDINQYQLFPKYRQSALACQHNIITHKI